MTDTEAIKLLCDLFQSGKGSVGGVDFKLMSDGKNILYLTSANKAAVESLCFSLAEVCPNLTIASNAAATTHGVVVRANEVQQLANLLEPLNNSTIDNQITTLTAKIKYEEFKAVPKTVMGTLNAEMGKLTDPAHNALKTNLQTSISNAVRDMNKLNALSVKIKNNTATDAEKQEFNTLLDNLYTFSITQLISDVTAAHGAAANGPIKTALHNIVRDITTFKKRIDEFSDVSKPLGKVVQAIHQKNFYEQLKALGQPDDEKKKIFHAVKNFERFMDPLKAKTALENIIKKAAPSGRFNFLAKADESEYYIQCTDYFPKEVQSLQIQLIHNALIADMGKAIGLLDAANGKIILTPAEAEEVKVKYGRLALPAPGAPTKVKPLAGGGPAGGAGAAPKFDLFLAANKTALKTAVENKLNLKWDEANPNSIRIYKDGEAPQRAIYLQKATNSLETLSKDPEVYARIADLMKEMMPNAPGAEGVTAVEISNPVNDRVELAKMAKEMLDKGLGVKVDFSAKSAAIPVLDEANFLAELKRVGGAGGDALVQKYKEELNKLEPPAGLPRP